MPTYREDLHLGHAVPTTDTADIVNGAITEEKMANDSVSTRTIQDGAVTEPKLADDAVSTRTIQNLAVTEPKLADNSVSTRTIINHSVTPAKLSEGVHSILSDLQNQIDSFNEHGLSVSNHFGDGEHIGISQKTLTEAVNNIYILLEEALDRTLLDFTWELSRTYVYGDKPMVVDITAAPYVQGNVFEHLELSVNGEKIDEADDIISYTSPTLRIGETSLVRLDAWILGKHCYREQQIVHYDSFWMGAGATYQDVYLDGAQTNMVDISNGMRVTKNIAFTAQKPKLFIILGEYLENDFVRADINGVEIPMSPIKDRYSDERIVVIKSLNNFSAGEYNIDING